MTVKETRTLTNPNKVRSDNSYLVYVRHGEVFTWLQSIDLS